MPTGRSRSAISPPSLPAEVTKGVPAAAGESVVADGTETEAALWIGDVSVSAEQW